MGLSEIIDIRSTQQTDNTGQLVEVFEVVFQTEETSGTHSIEVPAEDFQPDTARARAEEQAETIDQAITG